MIVCVVSVTFICITIYLFDYIWIFVPIWVMGLSFILMSTVRPVITPGIVRAITISIVILASS